MSDTLIFTLSSIGRIKLDQFQELFRTLYTPGFSQDDEILDIDLRYQAIRALDSLGYCEFDFEKRMVYMCEPSLVLLPSYSVAKAILTGARSPTLIKEIKNAVKQYPESAIIKTITQGKSNIRMPTCIYIEAIRKDIIVEIAKIAKINCYCSKPTAWSLINISQTKDQILANLHFSKRSEPNLKTRYFSVDKLSFSYIKPKDNTTYYMTEYRDTLTQQLTHWLWKNDSAAEVNRDWGRYLLLNLLEKNVILYDEINQQLAIPATVPLPCLISRSVALCSGLAPQITTYYSENVNTIPAKHKMYVYSNVPFKIVQEIENKLGQKIIYKSMFIDREGKLHA